MQLNTINQKEVMRNALKEKKSYPILGIKI